MPRYRIALRLAKPYQCLYCTLMPEFDCDHLPLDVANALDETFRTMSAIPLVSDGEGSGPGDSIVDIVHRNRELTTAHSTVYSIIVRALTGEALDPEAVGICYQPFVGRMHRRCFGEGMETDAHMVELFEVEPVSRAQTLVRHWDLVSEYAET